MILGGEVAGCSGDAGVGSGRRDGDTPLWLRDSGSTYEAGFAEVLERLCAAEVRAIYFGHGPALRQGCVEVLHRSLELVRAG
jgi:hypothetical protein